MERPLISLNVNTPPISDADEEIFLLYTTLNRVTNLVGPDGHHGLGHIDSRKDTLAIRFELNPPVPFVNLEKTTKKAKHTQKKALDVPARAIVIEIAQDPTALRSRNGDTGSVVWRASTELAKTVLQQHFFPPELPIFDQDRLRKSHCLELGAGTGLLGIALAPLVRTFTMTDIAPLLPLIRKNVLLNSSDASLGNSKSNITIEELDWLALTSLPPGSSARSCYCPVPGVASNTELKTNSYIAWDLVLVVDCIYNPSLLSALVGTIDAVSTAGQTWVLVVAELRQEDVLREFLDLWLKQNSGKWEITRIDGLLDAHFVVWAGWKH